MMQVLRGAIVILEYPRGNRTDLRYVAKSTDLTSKLEMLILEGEAHF